MNRSRIEWCDHTLNIITGCLSGCQYCYARGMTARFTGDIRYNKTKASLFGDDPEPIKGQEGKACYVLDHPFIDENGKQVIYPFGFEPTFHRYRLDILDKLKSGNNIFVGAMTDMFGPWVPDSWIMEVLEACKAHEKNNYLFLTKFPGRYEAMAHELPIQRQYWYGTTITQNKDLWRLDKLPSRGNTFLSMEPILEKMFIAPEDLKGIRWLIIGAETGRRKGKVIPEFDWVKRVVLMADNFGIPVFMKDSMIPIVQEKNMRREYPPELENKPLSDKVNRKINAECIDCGKTFRRSGMVTLSAKVGRGGRSKAVCTMCRKCYVLWCRYHKLESHVEELYGDETGREVPNEETQLQKNEG